MTDLSLVTLEEITEELKKRYKCFVVITNTSFNKETEMEDVYWDGGCATAVGLCEWAKNHILDGMPKPEKDENA